jgi:hypothetical protein
MKPRGSSRCRAEYSEPCWIRSTSLDICWTCSEMAHPCCGPRSSVGVSGDPACPAAVPNIQVAYLPRSPFASTSRMHDSCRSARRLVGAIGLWRIRGSVSKRRFGRGPLDRTLKLRHRSALFANDTQEIVRTKRRRLKNQAGGAVVAGAASDDLRIQRCTGYRSQYCHS